MTGANGYIGKRLLPVLLQKGHDVVCCVRDKRRFPIDGYDNRSMISIMQVDFLKEQQDLNFPSDIDVAFYLIHSMSQHKDFVDLERRTATNFINMLKGTGAKQVIYLGGITNDKALSKHLASRKNVETILKKGTVPVTALRAGIIVGSGSSSFEIIRDLVEKLPVMIAPKWLKTKTQPIAIRNVLEFLSGVLLKEQTYNRSFDIAGPDILSYKELLLQFADVRGLRRYILSVPFMTPRLSSYWLYFITSTSYKLAVNLVNSMKVKVIAEKNNLSDQLGIELITYRDAVQLAFQKIEQNAVVSSWKDSLTASYERDSLLQHIEVPVNGCFMDKRKKVIEGDPEKVLNKIWAIGGKTGWYYGNRLWKIRGFLDKVFRGVGLRRGRTNETDLYAGDTLDFWRVIAADRRNSRLLLFAEMRLPGEAWLEFKIDVDNNKHYLYQTATFRPRGLMGRLYWYAVLPFHFFVFEGMAKNIARV